MVRRVEPASVTVWLALKESCTVTLRVYTQEDTAEPVQQCEGTRPTIRLGDHLHLAAVTASTGEDARLHWSELYYYDLFFLVDDGGDTLDKPVPETAPHLYPPGILTLDPDQTDPIPFSLAIWYTECIPRRFSCISVQIWKGRLS